jgi:glutamate dehydrogenase (NAD(P)+)
MELAGLWRLKMPVATQDELNVYESAEARFEAAAQKLELEEGLYRYLKYPSREITVYVPVALDNGHLEVFIGYRVLHSAVRGPGKAACDFLPTSPWTKCARLPRG